MEKCSEEIPVKTIPSPTTSPSASESESGHSESEREPRTGTDDVAFDLQRLEQSAFAFHTKTHITIAPEDSSKHEQPEPADADDDHAPTIGAVFRRLAHDPMELLVRRWNWKAALFSSMFRGAIFFIANFSAGFDAAVGAMLAEFTYRAITAGTYGAMMQAFRKARPAWAATGIVMVGIPAISHLIEFMVHWLRGTPNLGTSIVASISFTALTTLYNMHMMRRGVMVVGRDGGGSLLNDIKQFPRITISFVTSGFGFLERRSELVHKSSANKTS